MRNAMAYSYHEPEHFASSPHREDELPIHMAQEMRDEIKLLLRELNSITQSIQLNDDKERILTAPKKHDKLSLQTGRVDFPELLDSADVMQWLRISKRTLQNYRKQGVIPFIKFRGKILYNRKDVAALLKVHPHK